MDGKDGIMMCKLKGRMDKGGKGNMMWKSKGGYKGGNIMCGVKGQMDKGGHYYVQKKGECKRVHYDVEIKLNGHRGHYHFQIIRADG